MFNEMKDICIEFSEILPGDFSQKDSSANKILDELVGKINNSTAEVIILFTKESNVYTIFQAAIKHSLNRVWIASDAWSTSGNLSPLSGIEKAGKVFGFISERNEVPGFEDYVNSAMLKETTNDILENFRTLYPNCEPINLANMIDQDASYNIYLAVEVIVEGLRHLLKCDNHQCERSPNFTALEVQ
ncbi:hypothetical protein PBY51_010360 [Eleginops maclovinus]|uniref:Receptor ligand binding region domain-containing protein n=1 Tax=Eleginops maclovinus TaxID=56733 RepID=A0AAN7XAM0_ELEMC|nr:hypothetical protein PBY51_010360 [Eleginops maclovinus]